MNAALWNVVIVYFTLGFRQFSHYFTDIHLALNNDDVPRAREILHEWTGIEAADMPVSEIVRQRIQPIRLEGVGAQQIHEALGDISASDAQPSTLELTCVTPTSATDLQDPSRSAERVNECVDLAGDPLEHGRCLGGVLGRGGIIGPDRVLVGGHAVAPVDLE